MPISELFQQFKSLSTIEQTNLQTCFNKYGFSESSLNLCWSKMGKNERKRMKRESKTQKRPKRHLFPTVKIVI